MSRRCSANPPCAAILGTVRELCGKAGVNSMALCCPLPYGLHIAPSKKDSGTLERGTDAYPTPALDNAMTLDQKSVSPPSPPALCGHPRHCVTIPGTAAPSPTLWEPGTTRHRHDRRCASTGLPSAAPSSQCTDGNQTGSSHTATLEAAPERVQGSPRRPTGARFVRTTINSTVLYTIPPYASLELCDTIVNRLPLAYKRRRRSPSRGRGRTDSGTLARFRLHHDIGTSPQSNLRDLEASPPLPPRL
jgi:hypothetical protein